MALKPRSRPRKRKRAPVASRCARASKQRTRREQSKNEVNAFWASGERPKKRSKAMRCSQVDWQIRATAKREQSENKAKMRKTRSASRAGGVVNSTAAALTPPGTSSEPMRSGAAKREQGENNAKMRKMLAGFEGDVLKHRRLPSERQIST